MISRQSIPAPAAGGRGSSDPPTLRAIEGARAGDSDSVRLLYEQYAPRVHRYLRRLVGDEHEAEDLTQQVFLKLITRIRAYEQREGVPFVSWLLRVAHNVAIDHLRAPRPVPTESLSGLRPDHDDVGAERARSFHEALASLPPVQRRVVVLRHVAGLSPAEIADVMGRSEGAVHGLHHRGRGALIRELISRQAAPSTQSIDLPRAA